MIMSNSQVEEPRMKSLTATTGPSAPASLRRM